MASILEKVRSRIGRFFRLKPRAPKPPRIGAGMTGHRGIAAGSLKERRRKQEAGEEPYTAEEISKWKLAGDVEAFVNDAMPFYVHSTNVAMVQYHIEAKKMMVEFLNGSAYLYSNVTPQEALEFAQAQSKGAFIWDRFRVRGSRTAHRKPYVRIK